MALSRASGDGGMSYSEFTVGMLEMVMHSQHHARLRRLFNFIDDDGSGDITRDELDAALASMLPHTEQFERTRATDHVFNCAEAFNLAHADPGTSFAAAHDDGMIKVTDVDDAAPGSPAWDTSPQSTIRSSPGHSPQPGAQDRKTHV